MDCSNKLLSHSIEQIQRLGLALDVIRKHSEGVSNRNKWYKEISGGEIWHGDVRVTHFSDCLAISCSPLDDGRRQLIQLLDHLSNDLLQHGFLLRGGVTIGEIYHQDSMAFGPAFLKAYELESKFASNPRIILDPVLSSAWGQGDIYLNKDRSYLGRSKTWRLSEDNYRFFDFIQPFGGAFSFSDSFDLLNHRIDPLRKVILDNLRHHKSDQKIFDKYIWLAKYLNEVCEENSQHGFEKIDFGEI